MAAYLKCWLLKPKLNICYKTVTISLSRKTVPCSSFHSSERLSSRHVAENKTTVGSDKNALKGGHSSLQTDQEFIDEIYRQGKEEDKRTFSKDNKFHFVEKENYFKQAWQRKLNTVTQHKFTRNFEEDLPSKTQEENLSGDKFGMLQGQLDTKRRGNRVVDFTDSNERIKEEFPDDKDEERDWRRNIPLTRYGRLGRKAFYYTKKMTKLGREGKINEAMQVLDEWMLTQDRVMPSKRTFITLIGIVGRAGYTRKAFQLFRQMKHLGLDPPDQVYTSLFNACANCPMPEYGLKRANTLHQHMQTLGIPPSNIPVMAAMKAFALCGDFSKAFQILDETQIPIDEQCFNSLLIACVSDKESGFRRALKVWQKMREYSIKPSHQTYNLFVRCIRDCGVGDIDTLASELGLDQGQLDVPVVDFFTSTDGDSGLKLLMPKPSLHSNQGGRKEDGNVQRNSTPPQDTATKTILTLKAVPLPEATPAYQDQLSSYDSAVDRIRDHGSGSLDVASSSVNEESLYKNLESSSDSIQDSDKEWRNEHNPYLLVDESQLTMNKPGISTAYDDENIKVAQLNIVSGSKTEAVFPVNESVNLLDLKTRPGRLALVGGVPSLLSHMGQNGVQPDTKTFTVLLSCIPNNAAAEALILKTMGDMGVTPDLDFMNDVMMRRNMRHESHTVKEILLLVSKLRLTPNMRTYAAMALTCHHWSDAQDLLKDMKAANVEPTVEIIGHLIYISRLNFLYKRCLLQEMEDLALKPSTRIIAMIEKSIALAKRHIVTAEKSASHDSFYLQPKFQRHFKEFLTFYQSWLVRTEMDKQNHPWERFTDAGARKKKEKLLTEELN